MKRRLRLTLFFLSVYFNSFSQLPVIRTNVTDDIKIKSLIYNHISKDFDFAMAFTASSYWTLNKISYQGLALDGATWKKFTLTAKRKRTGKITRPIINFKPFKTEVANGLIADLTKEKFWTLDRDSLNIDTQLSSDSATIRKFGMTDGTTFRFEVLSKVGFRIIDAYEPEYYLKRIPEIRIRENFIRGANLFLNALKE